MILERKVPFLLRFRVVSQAVQVLTLLSVEKMRSLMRLLAAQTFGEELGLLRVLVQVLPKVRVLVVVAPETPLEVLSFISQ